MEAIMSSADRRRNDDDVLVKSHSRAGLVATVVFKKSIHVFSP